MSRRRHNGKSEAQHRAEERTAQVVAPASLGPPPSGPGVVIQLEEFVEKTASASYRWRNFGEHPLDLALDRGKITRAQHIAGSYLRVYVEAVGKSNADSTDLDRVDGGGSNGCPFTQRQVDAVRALKAMQSRMYPVNWIIVRSFCGDGHSMTQSLRNARIPFDQNGVCARVQEALDELARKLSWRPMLQAAGL